MRRTPEPARCRSWWSDVDDLEAAVAVAGAPYEVLEAVNVEICGGRLTVGRLTVPDIVVVRDVAKPIRLGIRARPYSSLWRSSRPAPTRRTGSSSKPRIYAEAGIEFYWRFELESRPHRSMRFSATVSSATP
jgi:hypothetical protein